MINPRMEKEVFEARYIKGKAEGKLQIASAMLNLGLAAATIAQYTGLRVDDIERLKS